MANAHTNLATLKLQLCTSRISYSDFCEVLVNQIEVDLNLQIDKENTRSLSNSTRRSSIAKLVTRSAIANPITRQYELVFGLVIFLCRNALIL